MIKLIFRSGKDRMIGKERKRLGVCHKIHSNWLPNFTGKINTIDAIQYPNSAREILEDPNFRRPTYHVCFGRNGQGLAPNRGPYRPR